MADCGPAPFHACLQPWLLQKRLHLEIWTGWQEREKMTGRGDTPEMVREQREASALRLLTISCNFPELLNSGLW